MINGTLCLVFKNGAELVGQAEFDITYNGELIDISNKSSGNWVCKINNELASQDVQFRGTVIYNNSAVYESVKNDAFNGLTDTYAFVIAGTGERIDGLFMPVAMSDTVERGNRVSTAITFRSSNVAIRTGKVPSAFAGVQIGQAIITPETVWHNSNDEPVFDLLPVNSSFDVNIHTELAALYPSGILPDIAQETGSPFPYKYVADYTGV